jgi:hypothetical protein
MVFDPATFVVGDGHVDVTVDEVTGDVVEPGAPAPSPAPPTLAGDPRFAAQRAAAARQAPPAPAGDPPAAEEQQQQEEKPEGETADAYELQVPEFVSQKEVTEERQSYVTEFQQLAPEVGIDAATAQGLLDVAVDSAVALDYTANPEATAEDARAEMTRLFGEKAAKGLIVNAQKYAHARGEAFMTYLDTTGLGSDPAVLVALAFAESKYFTYKPAEAQEQIQRLMTTPEYSKGDKLVQIKLHVLSRIAHGGQSENEQLAAAAQAKASERAVKPTTGADGKPVTDARTELATLMKKDSPLMQAGHRDHAAAVKRFHELAAKI